MADAGQKTFGSSLKEMDLSPLWDVLDFLITPTPKPKALAHIWRYSDIRPLLMEAGNMISAEEAERRVLILENPGFDDKHQITDSLYAGLQLVLPGELAPPHRHSQSALRFVLEGEKASTSVDGHRVEMNPFDVILTPNGYWHEHAGGTSPAIWLDGLDIPILGHFTAGFAEGEELMPVPHPNSGLADAKLDASTKTKHIFPISHSLDSVAGDGNEMIFHFPYDYWRDALETLASENEADPHLGWMIEFKNPATPGGMMNTISAFVQKITKHSKTKGRRQTAGSVYVVVEGSAVIRVDEKEINVTPKDIIAVPSWSRLEIMTGSEDLILFSYSDRVCHKKLGFWREQKD
ncbi:MAG: cupin domain-containing protein [Kordiimonadaceae bacterium]|nr:cupin domain-containing protein [Kordiimonadaceae bacterium]